MGDWAVFQGDSIHTLDPKNRVFVPKRFQGELTLDAEGQRVAVLTRGFGGCLFLDPQPVFQREERMIELPGDYAAIADYVAAHAVPRG